MLFWWGLIHACNHWKLSEAILIRSTLIPFLLSTFLIFNKQKETKLVKPATCAVFPWSSSVVSLFWYSALLTLLHFPHFQRPKTDSAGSKLNGASSLNDVREVDMKSRKISGPLCARRMCWWWTWIQHTDMEQGTGTLEYGIFDIHVIEFSDFIDLWV